MTTYNESKKQYYQKVKDNYKVGGKWHQSHVDYMNRPSVKSHLSETGKQKHRSNPVESIFRNAKARAIKYGLEFAITKEDIIIPEVCPYLGVKLVAGTYAERRIGNAPTLDRIDSDKGYVKGNIEVISDLANRMKQNANAETLITFSKSVLNRFSPKTTE
jgi:hypothetical protein